MIQTTNESPTVWSVDELMARLDHDCYLTIRNTGQAVIVNLDEQESVEAILTGDDIELLLAKYKHRLCGQESLHRHQYIFGTGNVRMAKQMLGIPLDSNPALTLH